MIWRTLARCLPLIVGLMVLSADGQAQFLILAQDEDGVQELRNASTLTLASEGVGDNVEVRISVAFQGPDTSTATVDPPDLQGSRTFTIRTGPALPAILGSGDTIDFVVTFRPTGIGPFSNRLTLNLTQNDLGRRPQPMDVVVNLSGVVADFTVSFQIVGEGNEVLLADGGTLEFPETELEESSTATVIVTNRGSGPGTVRNILFDGEDVFEVSGIPLLPAEVAGGRDLRFNLEFTPLERRVSAGSFTFTFGLGSQSIAVMGPGVGALFLPEINIDGVTTPIPAKGTISLPGTQIGDETSAVVRVINSGNFEGDITTIAVSGDGFSLSDTPILPATLDPGDSVSFTLTFEPLEPGAASGQLRINDQTFSLMAEALGVQITYAVFSESGRETVEPPETLVFPQTRIGRTSDITFEITNEGNVNHTVTGIGLSGAAFLLSGVPQLPARIGPDETLAFTVTFEPNAIGPLSGTLTVNAATFTLSGVGEELEDLPPVTLGGSGGVISAAQQIATSLTLARPFPVDLSGTLTLEFKSDVFSNDPSVQFATGGRTVDFTIAEGQTEAEFVTGAKQVLFQTGTVAGMITLTSSFQSEVGGFDVTPDPAPELDFTVNREAPQLRDIQVTALSNTNVTVQITGFATSRTVTQLDFQFAAAPGSDLQTPSLTANVETPFRSWYLSNQSVGFGSQFTATVNFTVDGDVGSIDSVTATATNELGVSQPVTIVVE